MRAGTLIDYRIRVHGIPIRWRTEIAVWQPPSRFVDVQLRGPYTLWHHTHTFETRDGGTLCADQVRYRPRGGALVNWLFVRRDVQRIFRYRQQRMHELFGTKANETAQPASNRYESGK
jgi:ligand-binding SRPBCC domain-containing protein